jgi:hypothetical protein
VLDEPEPTELDPADPLAPGVTSKRGEDEFWLDELVDELVLSSNGCAPGVVVSLGVVEPTPGDDALPPVDPLELELDPDCPEAGPPEASFVD